MHKGSACVEVFRNASHLVAEFFGNPDRNRRSKEIAFQEDMRVLVEDMDALHLHRGFREHSVSKPVEDIMVDPALEHPVFPLSDSESDSGSTRSSNSEEADEESSGEADEESSGDQVTVDESGDMVLSYNTAKDLLLDDDEDGALGGGGEYDRGDESL